MKRAKRGSWLLITPATCHNFPGLKTVRHVCVLGAQKAAWFEDTEGNILCLHEDVA